MNSSTITRDTVADHTLAVPGARIHYRVRGAGPVLAIIGAPMGSTPFEPLANALASTHTVVTYDPRGSEHSTVTTAPGRPPRSCWPTTCTACWRR